MVASRVYLSTAPGSAGKMAEEDEDVVLGITVCGLQEKASGGGKRVVVLGLLGRCFSVIPACPHAILGIERDAGLSQIA